MPAISVIMPVYNGERYLAAAIESILAQTERDFEMLVIDDGSTDRTPEILRGFEKSDARVQVIWARHGGIVAALNAGLAAAQGEFVARMDADDLALPERFALQLAYLRAHPKCVVVGTGMMVVDPDGAPLYVQETETAHDRLLAGLLGLDRTVKSGLAHPSVMLRTAAARQVGGYRAEWEWVEDVDLWLRLATIGRLANLPETLLRYRLHENSVCHRRRRLQQRRHALAAAAAAPALGFTVLMPDPESSLDPEQAMTPNEIYRHWSRLAAQGGFRGTACKYAWRLFRHTPDAVSLWAMADALLGIPRTDSLKKLYARLRKTPRSTPERSTGTPACEPTPSAKRPSP